MRIKDMTPEMQAMLKALKKAKKDYAAEKALAQSNPINYEMETTYLIDGTEQSITLELAAQSDLTAWKESDQFLRDFYADESIEFKGANLYQKRQLKFTTNDHYFYIWRQTT